MSSSKINVLSTRSLDLLIINKAANNNIFVDSIPFIETKAIESEALIEQIKTLSSQKIIAIFTSKNAVDIVSSTLTEKTGWKIYCTGGATKERVKECFGEETIIASAKSSSALAEKIIANTNVKEVVFFCGDQRLDDLPETLKAHNIAVNEMIVYQTFQTPKLIEEDYEGILFFSPSAVHSFFSLNTIHTDVTLFAIGKTTAATIGTYVANKIITSEWPGREQMIDLVVNYFKGKKIKEGV